MKLRVVSKNEVSGHSKSRFSKEGAGNVGQLKITKISQQIKKSDRYSVYINGKYSFH